MPIMNSSIEGASGEKSNTAKSENNETINAQIFTETDIIQFSRNVGARPNTETEATIAP